MSETAIISDLHANIEATDAVLNEIDGRGINTVICLGDLVGFGPNPRETIERAEEFDVTLRGAHEEALLFMGNDFVNPDTQRAISWTRDQLNNREYPEMENQQLWTFIGNLPEVKERNGNMFVHASPMDPTGTPIRPSDTRDRERWKDLCSRFEETLFCGNTHKPLLYTEKGGQTKPDPDGETLTLDPDQKHVINVGSVGQPRDGNSKACWVELDGKRVTFHRVQYDVQRTMQKIRSIDQLSPFLANRLQEGR